MLMDKVQNIQALSPKERILLTAYRLFYQEGIRATGIDRVIAESSVSKVTFYRHFPSKNELIRAFLEYRHQRWIAWFTDALQRYGNNIDALIPALSEWFHDEDFRGCAFINAVGELGNALPEVFEITRSHKQEMTDAIESLYPPAERDKEVANSIALAVDGAIVVAQFGSSPDTALKTLASLLDCYKPK